MRAYRSAWLTVCAASCVIGVAFAVFVCPPPVFLLLVLAAFGIAILAVKVSPPRDGQVARHVGRTMAVSAPALLGVCGLIGGFAELGWLWLFCLAIGGVPIWWQRHLDPAAVATEPKAVNPKVVPAPRAAEPLPPVEVAPLLKTDTAAICWTWRRSYLALQQARRVEINKQIVAMIKKNTYAIS